MSEQQFVEYRGLTPDDFAAVRAQIDDVLRSHCAPGSWRYTNDYGDVVGAEGTALKVARPDGWGGLDALMLVDDAYCDAFSDEGTVWNTVVTEVLAIMKAQWDSTHPDSAARPFYASDKPEPAPVEPVAVTAPPVAATPAPAPSATTPAGWGKSTVSATAVQRSKTTLKPGQIPASVGPDGDAFVEYEGFPEIYWDAVKGAVEEAIRLRYADHEWKFVPEPDQGDPDYDDLEVDWTPGEYRTWLQVIDQDAHGESESLALVYHDYCMAHYKPGTRWGDTCEDLLKIMSEEWDRRGDPYNDRGDAYDTPFFCGLDGDEEDA